MHCILRFGLSQRGNTTAHSTPQLPCRLRHGPTQREKLMALIDAQRQSSCPAHPAGLEEDGNVRFAEIAA